MFLLKQKNMMDLLIMELKEYFRVKHSKNNFANGKTHKRKSA